jgi:hypothetical protein
MFYQAAEASALEIRPLILFYGTLAFATALVICRRLVSAATMPRAHGLKDVSPPNARLDFLRVRVESSGTFQRFNDTIAALGEFRDRMHGASFPLPSSGSAPLVGMVLTLRDVLARTPGLESLYSRTYQEPALTKIATPHPSIHDPNFWFLQLTEDKKYADRSELYSMIERWRNRFPMLHGWRVVEATRSSWGETYVQFANVPVPGNELDDQQFVPDPGRDVFRALDNPERDARIPRVPLEEAMKPGGAFQSSSYLIAPLNGVYLSEYSLQYMGVFVLSSLVRYRPQAWVHSITRSVTHEHPADDSALALVSDFMRRHAAAMPRLIRSEIGDWDY